MHTLSHWANGAAEYSVFADQRGGLFTCRSATLGWIAPTEQSSGLQIALKRPGQGYRFLWALVPWLHLWLDSQIYKNKPAHFWRAKGNTDEEIFIHLMKGMPKCNYYFELWNQAPQLPMPKNGLWHSLPGELSSGSKWTLKILPYFRQALEFSRISFLKNT